MKDNIVSIDDFRRTPPTIQNNDSDLKIGSSYFKPSNVITFSNDNGDVIGKLNVIEDKLVFEGDAEKSAKVFFDYVLNMWNE